MNWRYYTGNWHWLYRESDTTPLMFYNKEKRYWTLPNWAVVTSELTPITEDEAFLKVL